MSDLVDRLRALPWHEPAIAEAADEIERLTALLKKYEYPPEHRVSVAEQRIAELEDQCEALQNKCATRGLSPEDSDALEAENERLRAALNRIRNFSRPEARETQSQATVRGYMREVDKIAKAALKGGV